MPQSPFLSTDPNALDAPSAPGSPFLSTDPTALDAPSSVAAMPHTRAYAEQRAAALLAEKDARQNALLTPLVPGTTSVSGGPGSFAAVESSGQVTPAELDIVARSAPVQQSVPPEYQVTLPRVQPPVEPPPGRLGSAKTGGVATATPGTMPVLDERLGVPQLAKGATALATAPQVPVTTVSSKTGQRYATTAPGIANADALNAGSDLLEGAMKAGTPLALAGALLDLPVVAGAWALSYVAAAAAGKAADMANATPEEKRFAENVAGTVTALGGAKLVMDRLGAIPEIAKAAAQPRLLAGVLRVNPPAAGRTSGYGPGDVPGYRPEPTTMDALERTSQRPPSAETLAIEESVRNVPPAEAVARPVTAQVTAPVAEPIISRTVPFVSTDPAAATAVTPPTAAMTRTSAATRPILDAIAQTGDQDAFVVAGGQRLKVAQSNYGMFGRAIAGDIQLADNSEISVDIVDRVEDAAGTVLWSKSPEAAHEAPITASSPDVPRATPSGAATPFVSTDPAAATTITEGSPDATERADQSAPPAGPRREDNRAERGAPDESGAPARGSEGDRAPRGGLPADAADQTKYDGLTFVRQPAAHAQARLTPEVRRELGRMQEELDTFPFTEATWTDLSHEHGLHGNVAGGHMQKIPASGGAPVYEDIVGEAPLATPRKGKDGEPHVARKVSGGRGDVREAIRRVLAASDIHNHLAEGAVRVAERRAAGDYHGLSAPWLPPSWETSTTSDEIPADLDALIDELAAAEGVDPAGTSDTLDTGEEQPRLPEAGAVRDRDVATPTFDAPFTLSGGADTTPKEREADLFARDLEDSRKKDGPQFSRVDEPNRPGSLREQIAALERMFGGVEDVQREVNTSTPRLAFTDLRDEYFRVAEAMLVAEMRRQPDAPELRKRVDALNERLNAAYKVMGRTRVEQWERVRNDPQFSRTDKPTLTRKERDRIHAAARAEQRALQEAYATMPTVRLGARTVPVYDTGKRLTPGERRQLLRRPEVRRLFTVITEATDAVVAALLEEPTGVERIGILLDAAAYGVFFPKPGTPPAGSQQVATILINPFEPMRDDVGPLVAAATAYTTIVHEVTHWAVKGHGADFLQAYDEHLARLADSQVHVRAFQQLWEAYADITRSRAFRPGLVEAFSSYSASRGRRGTPGDALGRAAGYEQRPTDDAGGSRDAPREAGRDRSAAPRTVSVADLERLAERLGTTVAVQRARAEAAGYTIRESAQPVAQATVVPGVGAFLERDVTPGFEAAFKAAGEARSGILAVWAPGMASPDAETMGAIMRANLALRRQRTARAQRAMRALEVAWDKQPQAAQRAFAMAVDEGRVEDLPAWQQDLARVLTEINTKKRHEANALGGKVGYIKDYYPREWAQPGKVRAFLLRVIYGKRPLQGRAGFKKARSRDKETGEPFTFRQMIEAGFEPVSDNPITAHLRKWLEMDKWIAARRILLEGKRFGVATFVAIGDEPPEGQIRYPESFGTVYAPPVVTVQEAYDERLMHALHAFAESLGVKTVRRVKVGGTRWGYAVGDSAIVTKFAGPETVLEHEIGHILDERYGLREAWVKNKLMVKELRALADLRFEGSDEKAVPGSFRRYVRKGPEKIANLVHAFIYNPELAKKIAPNAYWALYNLAKNTPALHPLLTLQSTKSLVLGTAASEVAVGGLVIKGYYYGPPDAVRLLANHLSPGLRGHALFNLYRRTGNLLNQVQLGLSLFHLVMTSVDQVIGKSGMVLEHLARGQFKDAGVKALMTPVAPLIDVIRGDRLLKQFYAKDADFRTLTGVADAVARGGGGIGWDTFWHESAPERFLQAFRGAIAEAKAGNYPGAALRTATLPWRAVLAAVELQAKPIMEWWVPRLKLAAYWDLYRMELQDLGERPDEIELRKVAGRAWDSVDNWLGELIYDNLFWHSILKDAGMASVRALGWNLGTVRGAIGAVPRQLRQIGAMPGASAGGGGFGKPPTRLRHTRSEPDPEGGPDIPVYEKGRAPLLVHDFARLLSAFFWVGVYGAVYQYLHTGKKPGEDDDGHIDRSKIALDLYFPRTGGFRSDGRPERASIPSYVKEVYAFVKHPIETATHKAHPLGSLTYDTVVKNEDYFGTEIRNGDDPWVTQGHDLFTFIADQYQPISVRTFQQRRTQRGDTGIGAVESFFGISPAPQMVTRSDAEEYLHSIAPPTHRTKEQAVQAQGRRDLRAARQAGDATAAAAAIQQGNLSRRSIQLTAKSARQSSLQRSFQTTTLPQGLKAYELATPEERAELQLPLVQKWHNNFKNVPAGDKVALAARFTAAMKLPVTRQGLNRQRQNAETPATWADRWVRDSRWADYGKSEKPVEADARDASRQTVGKILGGKIGDTGQRPTVIVNAESPQVEAAVRDITRIYPGVMSRIGAVYIEQDIGGRAVAALEPDIKTGKMIIISIATRSPVTKEPVTYESAMNLMRHELAHKLGFEDSPKEWEKQMSIYDVQLESDQLHHDIKLPRRPAAR